MLGAGGQISLWIFGRGATMPPRQSQVDDLPVRCQEPMTDIVGAAQRSWMMSKVRDRDTAPELAVRSMVHAMGFRFRLHRRDLPGTPDLVLPRHEKVILVNGCFWHQHPGCAKAKRPASRREFWNEKLDANIERDRRNVEKLESLGWEVLVIWECETDDPGTLLAKLEDYLSDQ